MVEEHNRALQVIGQLPFTSDKAEEIYDRVINQFDALNTDTSLLIAKLNELKSDPERYMGNTQFEQITFKELNNLPVSSMIEKIELNSQDKEQTLLQGVVADLIRRFENRLQLPFQSIRHFKEYETSDNTIQVRVTGLPFTGLEAFAFILIADRLIDLRPSYKETLSEKLQIDKNSEETKFKSLSDEDVWFSHLEILDDRTIALHFIVLTFDTREKIRDHLDTSVVESKQHSSKHVSSMDISQQKPWYGAKRYDIVDHVLKLQEKKEGHAYRSAVQEAALKAQKPFQTQTMKEISQGGDFEGPPKYLNQRDAPLEIPNDIVKSFFRACDTDCDNRLSAEELYRYAEKHNLPFSWDEVQEMFHDAVRNRSVAYEEKKYAPLNLDEIIAAVRGRHRWNTQTKSWEVSYRPYRDYWIIMLQTVSERIFAMPVPKVVPTKILAQFEQEEDTMKKIADGTYSLTAATTSGKLEGMDRRYLSVKERSEPTFKRANEKFEASVVPTGASITLQPKKEKHQEKNPYEQLINGRLEKSVQKSPNGYPKVTFEARELYDQANFLSQVVPNWKSDRENPIFKYVPTSEQPFKNESDTFFNEDLQSKLYAQTIREQRLTELQGKDRSKLLLAGTQALKNSTTSPWQVMREREGFVTKFKVPTILDTKMSFAKEKLNEIDKRSGSVVKPKEDPYVPPKDPVFRDLELAFRQKDFVRQIRPEPAYNPHNLSEFNTQPKFVQEKQRRQMEAEEQRKKDEYLLQLKGEKAFNPDWIQYHKLPEKLVPISQDFKDKYQRKGMKKLEEKTQFLNKDDYETGYQRLARTLKDDAVFGKPEFDLYYKGLKPEHLNEEFGGMKTKPYHCL